MAACPALASCPAGERDLCQCQQVMQVRHGVVSSVTCHAKMSEQHLQHDWSRQLRLSEQSKGRDCSDLTEDGFQGTHAVG
jgi:hypothetical protein